MHVYLVIEVHYCLIFYYANKRQFFSRT